MNTSHARPISNLESDDEGFFQFRDEALTDDRSNAVDQTTTEDRIDTNRVYRPLTDEERNTLVANGNLAGDWTTIKVSAGFDPTLVHRCSFFGTVRIGALQQMCLQFHDLSLPVGLTDSLIISTDIGDNPVIRNVGYLSRYVIGNEVMLFNIDEMGATDHAKFGNGIVMEGEGEDVRIWLEIANENGGRAVLPFDGIETGDAHLWSRNRCDEALQQAFLRMTEAEFDTRRGVYASVGDHTVIKSCRIIKDVKVGPWAYIKGANKLKNLTINSAEDAPTQIGEGAELVNGIIEKGSRIFYGVKAVRFVMRTNTCLKYGARLINSILGDNGTISCCEVLNSLVMPGHEQHHNNSFLCAATVLGQSNMAAGATIGSNHNSRANDGEIVAGRGFWPGLSVTLKHSSRFSSFCLITKGSYPAELNIPLAFTLVATTPDHLILRPAFWFLHNMYALARNSWKYHDRDARLYRHQTYEYDFLAPDTADEILATTELLEMWTGMIGASTTNTCIFPNGSFGGRPASELASTANAIDTAYSASSSSAQDTSERIPLGSTITSMDSTFARDGKMLLESTRKDDCVRDRLSRPYELIDSGFEKTNRQVYVYDIPRAWDTYRKMAILYAVRALVACIGTNEPISTSRLDTLGIKPNNLSWCNVGGQLMRSDDHDSLLSDIKTGALSSWSKVHDRYASIAATYEQKRGEHALDIICRLFGVDSIDDTILDASRRIAIEAQRFIEDETRKTREKDYENPFRMMMYDSPDEMDEVVGSIDDNSFVSLISKQTDEFCRRVES